MKRDQIQAIIGNHIEARAVRKKKAQAYISTSLPTNKKRQNKFL